MLKALSSFFLVLLALNASAQQPNILLVIADDLGLDPTPNYLPGPIKANMPNLEALMATGLTFDNVWADPLCSPTRATMLTGRYGLYTGVLNANTESLLPANEITLHNYLSDINSGYATSLIGKWHLGGNAPDPTYPNTMGIPYYAGLLNGALANYSVWTETVNGSQTPSTEYITTSITDLAIDWIGQQTGPWFSWVAYTAPHTPFHLPPLNMHTQGALPTDQASIDADPFPYFLAMVESVDYEMGRLMDAIPAEQLANTVIIFIGDNGTDRNVIQAPYTFTQGKATLYQGGVHVPLVVAGPSVPRTGQRESALINSSDLFTTIVELTGATLPEYNDSKSFFQMLSQPDLSIRDCLYAEVSDNTDGYAIRNERYKLIRFTNNTERFYDLLNDPYEANNLLIGGLNAVQQLAYDALESNCNIVTSIPATDQATPSLFPNPVSDQLMIQRTKNGATPFSITSISGQLLISGTLMAMTERIDLHELPTGMYVLTTGSVHQRFVKE